MIDKYIKEIASITKRGDAREESYYGALKDLIEEYSNIKRRKKIHITTLPKKTEAGNPDFRVWDGKHSQVGYIEAKPPKAKLDEIENSEQLERYLATFPNLILTNFYEFRLYRDGKRIDQILLARPFIPAKLKTIPPAEHATEFMALLERFLQFSLPTNYTAESLAKELAIRTRFLRDEVIKEEIREARTEGAKRILGFYEAFQKHLISNLEPDQFADLYAQTITYGLFAARTRSNGVFNRKLAYYLIPKTIGILRDIFHFVSFGLSENMEATVDDIAEVLAVADVNNVLHEYFEKGRGSDPIFHFYETFLAAYNPKERERRGVYYTPEPVVSYIVRSLNIILKDTFGKQDGFADQSVTVLDPAGGTLTFLAHAAKVAVDEYVAKYGPGAKSKFIRDHILQHFFAFELMMAPYAAGHLKMGYLLEELGHKLTGEERFQYYLTNTLEMEELEQTSLPGMASLSEESHLAGRVKKERPILVILGNPPYSGISANASERGVYKPKGEKYVKGYEIKARTEQVRTYFDLVPIETTAKKGMTVKQKTWIGQLIEQYKIIDGGWFGERKHWLHDDYVKFIRFAQWKIDQIGEGVIGFITNHAYLDNPTFRGMRQSMMNSFDEIYILNLHGNSIKKEKAPDGSKDENVFDIRQGVAIVLLIKHRSRRRKCRIQFAEIWGTRENKYGILLSHDFCQIRHTIIQPKPPFYFFIPKENKYEEEYDKYLPIMRIVPVNSVGIVTARDSFAIDFALPPLISRITQFRNLGLDDEFVRATFGLKDTSTFKLSKFRRRSSNDIEWKRRFQDILYRPFDTRVIFYSKDLVERPLLDVMRHMLQPNIALCIGRAGQVVGTEHEWNIVFCSAQIEDFNLFYRGGNVNFPLYLYPDTDKHDLFSQHQAGGRIPNIAPKLIDALNAAYLPSPPAPLPEGEGGGTRAGRQNAHEANAPRKLPEYLLELCRQFRKQPTETEAMLWTCLRNRQLHGYKFRRQHPIGRYVADFYCDELRLVIEVDGGIHMKRDQKAYDNARQESLEDQGYTVVRVKATEIKRNPAQVLKRLIPSSLSPLPLGEGSGVRVTPGEGSGVRGNATPGVLPEDIFHYIYAILYSNAYRRKYAEFLKTDFPRIPFTKDHLLFQKLAEKGAELVGLHLLKSAELAKPASKCEGPGDLKIAKVTFDARQKRVYINPDKWFSSVSPDVWEYHIGGYQVSDKWLKDRKGRELTSEEVATYINVMTAISKTISIQQSLDDLFSEVEKTLLEIKL